MNCSFCAAAGATMTPTRMAAPAMPKSLVVIADLLADRASQERVAGHCYRGLASKLLPADMLPPAGLRLNTGTATALAFPSRWPITGQGRAARQSGTAR